MKIVRKELTPADLEPVTIRYDGDCECVQSLVGGEWVDNPPADPRTSSAYQYPAPDTADPACDAGARISAAIERIISTVFDAVSVIEAVSTMIGVAAVFFPPIALFVALLFALVSAANAIGFAAVQLAFTDDVYEQITCLVKCHIGTDGQFDEGEWGAFEDAVGSTFGISTVTIILSLMFNAMGMVGFNNMAAVGEETGDCSDCTDCDPPDLQIQEVGGIPYGQDLVMIDVGVWQCTSHDFSSENHWVLLETIDPLRKFQVIDITLISGGGGFPWYREFPLRGTDEYSELDPTGVPNINAVGQSRPDTGGFTIQYTIINS